MKVEKIFDAKEFKDLKDYSTFKEILKGNKLIPFLTLSNLGIKYFNAYNSFALGSNPNANYIISKLVVSSLLYPNIMKSIDLYLHSNSTNFGQKSILVIDIGHQGINMFRLFYFFHEKGGRYYNKVSHYYIPNTMDNPLAFRFVNLAKYDERTILDFVSDLNKLNISILDKEFRSVIAEQFVNYGFGDFIRPLFSIATKTIKKVIEFIQNLIKEYPSLKVYFATPFVYKINTEYKYVEQLYYSIIGTTTTRVFENAFYYQYKLSISNDLENLIVIPDIPYHYYGLTTFVKNTEKIENIEIYELYNGMYYKVIVSYSDGEMKEYLLDRNQIEILKLGFSKAVAKRIEDRLELIDSFILL